MDGKRILIVEDKKLWRDILRTSFEKGSSEYAITTAATYEEAMEKLQNERFALVTMDISLVGSELAKAGLHLVDYVTSFYESTQIIVVSGSEMNMKEMRDLFKEHEIHDFFEKTDFNRKRFLESVEQALEIIPSTESSTAPPPYDPARLHQKLDDHLNEEELRELCFDLEVDYDGLGGYGKSAKARELVAYLKRRKKLPRLIGWLCENRPDIEIQ